MAAREANPANGGLFWRSRASNRVNPWYYEQASGCYKAAGGDWTVFWRGLPDARIMEAVGVALALPPTFPARVYPPPLAAADSAGAAADPQVAGTAFPNGVPTLK